MPIANAWVFTETNFNAEEFLTNTHNLFRLVSQRPYTSKKDPSESGVTLTLLITKDDTEYGIDKKSGLERDNNVLNTFDVTVLNNKTSINVKKGEYVKLINYIPEKSFVIEFDLILRFEDVEKVNVKTK
ncbi:MULTISPECIES: hypothetical protein [Bacillota]|jgi:hypothetical protein|uniref:hypothetical protein n=1 Tax=Bacillota TaxID=1239 RepID=UPI000EA0FCAD|nr:MULTISPECIES: hypothetical protein [Bacillota]AYU55824.1 hypothetical protein CNQ82_10490 [Staphylococcus debuckii]MBC2919679.1 hypothetical protein [Staphylococcus saprophyticus]MBC2956966.1 hypothetical protein [Staphylococcus saprophyticus]MBC3008912.1 hypothetical protein [Staphylococcus saprophyticus]MBC3021997.1 hypothetical protein [Staphylococcus saprophyticus]